MPSGGAQTPPVAVTPARQPPVARKRRRWSWPVAACAGLVLITLCGLVGLFGLYRLTAANFPDLASFLANREAIPTGSGPVTDSDAAPQIQQDTPVAELNGEWIEYQGVSFSYDPVLADQVIAETYPADADPDPWPQFDEFIFVNYLHQDSRFIPTIAIFPVPEFENINPIAGEQLAELRFLLEERPSDFPLGIPSVPYWHSGQLIVTQVRYLSFQNGTGMRFITQKAQDIWPVNNEELVYIYEGLTTDGQYLVSASFPISHPTLPPDGFTYPGGDYETFEAIFEDYIADVEARLDGESAAAFFPSLDLLDDIVQSLSINR